MHEGQPNANPKSQEKFNLDPTGQFLRDQGFQGDPKVRYSMDVISARSENRINLTEKKTFENLDDLKSFLADNPDALSDKQREQMREGLPIFRTDYDESVYDWSREKQGKLSGAFDRFAAENLDTRKWVPKTEVPQGGKPDTASPERDISARLNNPEVAQYMADPSDLQKVVAEMGTGALPFEMERLSKQLAGGTPEELEKADQTIANYLYRTLSQEVSQLFHRTDAPLSWEDKKKLLDQSLLADKISKRPDSLKTRDMIPLLQRVREQIGEYAPKSSEKASEKQEAAAPSEGQKKFGLALNNFTAAFRDGTIAQLFVEFARSKPNDEQYEAAGATLGKLYGQYLNDPRLSDEKDPEFMEKLREASEQLNPDRLKFNGVISQLEDDLGTIDGKRVADFFGSLYENGARPTSEQWKNASEKMAQFLSEYRKDKRVRSVKSPEWAEKLKELSRTVA